MKAGTDYLVNADAPDYTGTVRFNYNWITAEVLADSMHFLGLLQHKPETWMVLDTFSDAQLRQLKKRIQLLNENFHTIEYSRGKLTWTSSTSQSKHVHIQISPEYRAAHGAGFSQGLAIKVRSKLQRQTQYNILGMIPGTKQPDYYLVLTAHYDHLGRMGKTAVFPGANDNAAGVAMMLDLARYYAKNPLPFSVVFIAFAGEETGLLGSGHFVTRPLIPLHRMRFLVNLDLVGTGETGMTVVNATVFSEEFALLDSLNRKGNYLPDIGKRGKAANSDHYFFTEAGVPAFFWYQKGPRTSYHDVQDVPETLSLAGYNGTFKLLLRFFSTLQ
ncbi:MAG: M28 family peptidase [Bacteroidetes bacterium]|nr:M28 family peptidase [Bacteroidota bacterium]